MKFKKVDFFSFWRRFLMLGFIPSLLLVLVLVWILTFFLKFLFSSNLPSLEKTNLKDDYFSQENIATPPPLISLVFTGDVIPARSVNSQMVRKNNFKYPFEKTAGFLESADLTIINLEAPLVDNCPITDSGMVFCGDRRFIEGLSFAGVDIASLANNHASNYGQKGVEETVALLNNAGIETVGINNIVYKEVKGIRLAFLAFNGVVPLDLFYIEKIDENEIKRKVEEAGRQADFVTVIYHWGREYASLPESDWGVAPFDPVEIGRKTIEAGADLVVGSHPHVVQRYEVYQGKLIFFSLGNFIFDQMWSDKTRLGVVLKVDLTGDKIESFSLYPVRIENYAQPIFLEGGEKEAVLKNLIESSN